MNNVFPIEILKISPYVRYVNEVHFRGPYEVAERVLYDHELIYCLGGEAIMHYGDKTWSIGKGQMFYLKPDITNTMVVTKGNFFHAHCVHFDWMQPDDQYNFTIEQIYFRWNELKRDSEIMRRLTGRPHHEVPESCMHTISDNPPYDVLAPLMKQLYQSFCLVDAGSRLKTRAVFMQVVSELLAANLNDQGVQRTHTHHKTISRAVAYMNRHFREDVTAPLLAEKFGLSPKYFGMMFKTSTGIPVHRFLLDIRMQEARRLLIHTARSLEEIAEDCGVGDVSYFTKLFKRHEGLTPGRHRRMLTEQGE